MKGSNFGIFAPYWGPEAPPPRGGVRKNCDVMEEESKMTYYWGVWVCSKCSFKLRKVHHKPFHILMEEIDRRDEEARQRREERSRQAASERRKKKCVNNSLKRMIMREYLES